MDKVKPNVRVKQSLEARRSTSPMHATASISKRLTEPSLRGTSTVGLWVSPPHGIFRQKCPKTSGSERFPHTSKKYMGGTSDWKIVQGTLKSHDIPKSLHNSAHWICTEVSFNWNTITCSNFIDIRDKIRRSQHKRCLQKQEGITWLQAVGQYSDWTQG